MKPSQRKGRRFGHQNPQGRKDHRNNRPKHADRGDYLDEETLDSQGFYLPSTPVELENYLADQMRIVIRARQQQEEALKEIRILGEQLADDGGRTDKVQEQYAKAVTSWQRSRRDGVNARQKLLIAMNDRVIPEKRQ